MPRPHVALPLLLALQGLGACLASPSEEAGSVEEFAALVARDAAPVEGSVQDGEAQVPEVDESALADPAVVAELQAAQEPEPGQDAEEGDEPPVSPYLRFGGQIIVREFDDGTTFVTKPYPLPPGKGAKLKQLLDALEPFAFRERPPVDAATGQSAPLDAGVVQFQLLEKWDEEFYSEPSYDAPENKAPQAPSPVALSDLFVVTATPDKLEEFEEFLDTFAAGVPQIELEAKIIEIVDTDSLDLGVRPIDDTTPIFDFGDGEFIKSLGYDLPNLGDPTEALLTLGAVQNGTAFNAVLEAVATWQNVTIESRPKTVVRSGALARLESVEEIPFFEVKGLDAGGNPSFTTSYKKVGIKLYIVPRVIGSRRMALEVLLEGSQRVGDQLTFVTGDGSTVQVPVIAYRTARTVVYLEPGETLVIGGLTRESKQESISKVPILGDIPILGFFFRSSFESLRREHVIFAISPRIIQSSEFQQEL